MKLEHKIGDPKQNYGKDNLINYFLKVGNYSYVYSYYIILSRLENTEFEKYLGDDKYKRICRYLRKKSKR